MSARTAVIKQDRLPARINSSGEVYQQAEPEKRGDFVWSQAIQTELPVEQPVFAGGRPFVGWLIRPKVPGQFRRRRLLAGKNGPETGMSAVYGQSPAGATWWHASRER